MKEFSLKKSMLMLVALFMMGACSTTGNDGDSTPSTDDKVKAALAGKSSAADVTSAEEVTTAGKDFYVSKDGATLTYIPTGETEAVEYSYKMGEFDDGDAVGYYADEDNDYVVVAPTGTENAYEVTELGTLDEIFQAVVGGEDTKPSSSPYVEEARYFTFNANGDEVDLVAATSTTELGTSVKYTFVEGSASINVSTKVGKATYNDDTAGDITVAIKANGDLDVDGISYTPQ